MVRDKLKAVVPVILGASDLGASIIARGGLPTRGDAADAFQLFVLGLLVYLVPNLDPHTPSASPSRRAVE